MKRLALSIGGVLLLAAALVFFVPSLRQSILGIALPLNLQEGRAEPIHIVSMLLKAREVRGLSSQPNFTMDDTVTPDVYDLALGCVEKTERTGADPVIAYLIKEENLAQIGVKKSGSLLNNVFSMRLGRGGVIENFLMIKGQESPIVDEVRMGQMLAPLWIVRPDKRVTVGEVWSGRWSIAYPVDTLDKAKINLEHRLNYHIARIFSQKDMELAVVDYEGSITLTPQKPLPSNVELVGEGHIKGEAWLNLKSGQVILADDRTAWGYAVRFLEEKTEDLRLFDRKSRIFRPSVMPNAGDNFTSAMPKDGQAPQINDISDKEPTANSSTSVNR